MGDVMSHDEMSNDTFDGQLTRLFADKNEPLPADEFAQQVLSRLDRELHLQWIRRGLVTIAILVLAAVLAPWVVQGTMKLFAATGRLTQLPGADVTLSIVMVLVGGAVFLKARKHVLFG